ncbi:Uroporphyrinogen-III synthase [compost metagenome]
MSLSGQRILVLRPRDQAQAVATELERQGAVPILLPALVIAPPEDPEPLEAALARLEAYDWLILTSVNGVNAVFDRIDKLPQGLRVAVVGPVTAQALQQRGGTPDLIPPAATAESLAEALLQVKGMHRVLFPKANRARDVLPVALRAHGVQVDDPVAYRSLPAIAEGEALDALRGGTIDWVLVTSPSTFEELVGRVDAAVWERTKLASIGPVSSAAIRKHGLPVAVEADPYTLEGLIAAIAAFTP